MPIASSMRITARSAERRFRLLDNFFRRHKGQVDDAPEDGQSPTVITISGYQRRSGRIITNARSSIISRRHKPHMPSPVQRYQHFSPPLRDASILAS